MALQDPNDVKVQQIRQAARELFLRHGFAGVSTSALAVAAGISKETLYSRYSGKEAVLADVLEDLILSGDLGTDTAPASLKSAADLDRALRSLARELSDELMQRDYIELARIVIAETPRLPRVGETFRRAVPQRAFQRVSELLRAGQRAGLVRDLDVMAATRLFVGPLVLHALINVLLVAPDEPETPPPMDVDPHVDLFLVAVSKESSQ